MATFTLESAPYDGRVIRLTITESINVKEGSNTLTWILSSEGGSVNYYSIAPTKVIILGNTVYQTTTVTPWDSCAFPAAKGQVSGTVKAWYDSNGEKTIGVELSTNIYDSTPITKTEYFTLTKIDAKPSNITLSATSVTATSVTIKASGSAMCDIWEYSINGGDWINFSNTNAWSASKTITGLAPNTSYSIKVRGRKTYNHVLGTSDALSVKTLGGSVISSVSTLTADAEIAKLTLSAAVYNTSYTHTLVIKNGSTTVLTLSGLSLSNGSNTITLTAAQRSTVLSAMAKIKSFTGTFVLTTYSGGAQIGTTSSKTATVQTTAANSSPAFSGFTYQDSNTISAGITGNNQTLIQGASILKIIAAAATAKNGATISSYSVVAGDMAKSSTSTEIIVGEINSMDDGTVPIIVTAIDSRGYTSSATVNATIIPYEKVNIKTAYMRRVNEVEAYSTVTISGDIQPVEIGETNKNALVHLHYRYKKTSDEEYGDYYDLTSLTEYENDSFTFKSNEWLSLDPDYSYYVEFLASDKLSSDTITLTVPQGTPLLSFRKKKVGVNNRNPSAALDVVGSVIMNGSYVLGHVAALGETEDLNDFTDGGIYTQELNIHADTDRHYPVAKAGFLEVIVSPYAYVMQRYTAFDNTGVYVRARYNGTWFAWKSVSLVNI